MAWGQCLDLLGKGGAGLSPTDGLGGMVGIPGLGRSMGGGGPISFPPLLTFVLVLCLGTERLCP